MPPADAAFEYAVAINWDRDGVTRGIATTLRLIGYKPETSFRPRILEDPKLFLTLVLLGVSAAMALGGYLLYIGVISIAKTAGKLTSWRTAPMEKT
jgi:hypothetical protein